MRLDLGGYKNGKYGYLALNIKESVNPDIVADITKLPFKDNSIESIYTRRTIQHIRNESEALSEIHRVLKAGGGLEVIVCSIFGFIFYHTIAKLAKMNFNYEVIRFYTNKSLTRKLTKAGFRVSLVYHIRSKRGIGYDIVCEASKLG